jgi:hypothetical protein
MLLLLPPPKLPKCYLTPTQQTHRPPPQKHQKICPTTTIPTPRVNHPLLVQLNPKKKAPLSPNS